MEWGGGVPSWLKGSRNKLEVYRAPRLGKVEAFQVNSRVLPPFHINFCKGREVRKRAEQKKSVSSPRNDCASHFFRRKNLLREHGLWIWKRKDFLKCQEINSMYPVTLAIKFR